MGYQEAIEEAGAKVKEFVEFGSYQGTWMALLEDGQVIEGSYGSCSGCDAYQSEFAWEDDEKDDYKERLKNFGQSYVEHACPLDVVLNQYAKKINGDYAWDDDKEIYQWLLNKKAEL